MRASPKLRPAGRPRASPNSATEARCRYRRAAARARGFVDLLLVGVGRRRGRPARVVPGSTIDFWRVETFEPQRRLRLSAEMKLPGRAWLEFEVTAHRDGATIRQTAVFDPVGLGSLLYWYLLYPFHNVILSGMLRGIRKAALREGRTETFG